MNKMELLLTNVKSVATMKRENLFIFENEIDKNM